MRTAVKAVTGRRGMFSTATTNRVRRRNNRLCTRAAGRRPVMELLEERYRYEKLMLQEVRQGNTDKALHYYRQFSRGQPLHRAD